MTAPAGVFLAQALAPLDAHLQRPDVTDLYINRPGELWVETLGGAIERHDVPVLTAPLVARMAEQIAARTGQGISRAHPLLAAVLPDGARAQFVAGSATRGDMAVALRKHQAKALTLDDYNSAKAFSVTATGSSETEQVRRELHRLLQKKHFTELLRLAVRSRLNILVAGGTSTGKTTFLNTLLREVDPGERLILIEDTPELTMHNANSVGLLASRGLMGEAAVDMNDLLTAALRMRPDRIILGELRGPEAFTFLRAVNTGHPGSITTIHADSPARAVEQLALLVLQSGTTLGRDDIVHYVRSTIDVYVQLGRIGGSRVVTAIELRGELD